MENLTPNHNEDPNKPVHEVETDYQANQQDPGPAPTVDEPNNQGAGPAMKWIIPIIVIILLVICFVFFRNNMTQ